MKPLISNANGNIAEYAGMDLSDTAGIGILTALNLKYVTIDSSVQTSYTPGLECIIYVDTSSDSVDINLPSASTSENRIYWIKKIAPQNRVRVIADGTDEIEFRPRQTLRRRGDAIPVHCDGNNWYVL